MNDLSPIGHNNPPDPIADCTALYDGVISEAQNWADGEPVTDEASMLAVDAVLKEFKTYKTALAKAGKERTDPLHKAWKAEVAAVKIYTDDADRIQSALVAVVAPYKAKREAERKEAERAAWEATNKARREADAIAAKANAANVDDQRAAAAAKQTAIDAENAAKAVAKDSTKGMRTVTRYAIEDHRAALNWIAQNDRDAITSFIEAHVQKHHKTQAIAGVKVWQEKEAY